MIHMWVFTCIFFVKVTGFYCFLSKVLEGRFVVQFGGEAMVAKPQSYQATAQLSGDDDEESSSRSVLGIALGVVFGVLAVVVIIGIIIAVSNMRIECLV